MQPILHELVQVMRSLFLQHAPASHARMNGPQATKKYTKVHHTPGTPEIAHHLAGRRTIATPLIGLSGLAQHDALNIGAGGTGALQQVLHAAHARGFVAYAVTSDSDEHTGGHVWLHFDQPTAPERARLLADQLAATAGVDAETYPTRKALRLPLGVHQWTGKRGHLLLHDGSSIDLDTGAAPIRDAIATVADLPRNAAANLPPVPPPPPHTLARQPRQERSHTTNNPMYDYNRTTNLLALLERYGGRIAQEYRDGGVLVHCPCGQHQHGDAHASLQIRPARNRARYGQYVASGHAPNCRFYTACGHVMDSFTISCRLAGLTTGEALAHQPRPTREVPR